MRRRLASFHITVLGWMLLVLVPIALLVCVFGPQATQVPALIVAVVFALLVVTSSGIFSGNRNTEPNLEAVERAGAEMGPGVGPKTIEQETYDPEGWRRERERREREQREG